MAKLCLHALLALLLLRLALSADPAQIPPSHSPELADGAPAPASGDSLSLPPSVGSPAASHISSPPSPPPSGSPPAPSPAPTAAPPTTPAPSQGNTTGTLPSGVDVADEAVGGGPGGSSGGGLSSTKKAGIVAGAIVFAGVVLLGAMVYKKRKDNIRRAQYSYAARREIL